MAYFINGYPYSDTHNLNLDWVIDTLKRIETEMGQLHDGLEIHVTGNDGTELYTFTVKANGVYITRPDGGTPLFYNFDSQTLHAPYFDGQSFLFASGRTTGQMRAGNLVLDNALPVAQGGTGSTNAAGAREALGAVNKAGDTMTGDLTTPTLSANRINTISESFPTVWYMLNASTDAGYEGVRMSDRRLVFAYRNNANRSQIFSLPPLGSDNTDESTWFNILTTRNIMPTLLTVNSGASIGNTTAHAVTLTDSPSNYLAVIIAVGWNAITDATGFVLIPSLRWNATSAMRIYANNNPSEQYVSISARTSNGLTYQASNSNMALAVYGLIRTVY